MHSPQIDQIKSEIEPLRQQLLNHPLYERIKTIEDLQVFMEHHMFAVWDFMSILKALQRELTCVEVPWIPKGSPDLRRLINEIVQGEESDVDQNGRAASHYELYLEAMQLAGASTSQITGLLNCLSEGKSVYQALDEMEVPLSISNFVRFSFDTIYSGKAHTMAAIFTFGREDLIPDMFSSLVKDLNQNFPGKLASLIYYLDRHIELDGGEHGPLALTMIAELCGHDETKWKEALEASKRALEVRIGLWNGILEEIAQKTPATA